MAALAQAGSLPVSARYPYRLFLCDLERLSGDVVHANNTYTQAREELEQALKQQPEDADWISNRLAEA